MRECCELGGSSAYLWGRPKTIVQVITNIFGGKPTTTQISEAAKCPPGPGKIPSRVGKSIVLETVVI